MPALPNFIDMVMGKCSLLFSPFVRGGFFKKRNRISFFKKYERDECSIVSQRSGNGTKFILICRATFVPILDHTLMFNWGSDPPNTSRGAWELESPSLCRFPSLRTAPDTLFWQAEQRNTSTEYIKFSIIGLSRSDIITTEHSLQSLIAFFNLFHD